MFRTKEHFSDIPEDAPVRAYLAERFGDELSSGIYSNYKFIYTEPRAVYGEAEENV